MAVFDITATLASILSKVSASGAFVGYQIGEPKSPPSGAGLFAAVFMADVSVVSLTGGTTIERHDVTLRIYRDMLAEPQGDIEKDLAKAVTDISNDLASDFDQGTTVRSIDIGGWYGEPLSTSWGYVEVSGNMYRTADMAIGLIVDDSSILAA